MDSDDVSNIISIILFIMFIVILIVSAAKCSNDEYEKKWNNGYCECGGHWQYEQAVGHQYRTTYIYKCDNCGRRIEVWKER